MDAKSAFEHYLWPALQQIGWKFEAGARKGDKYYLPPGIDTRRGRHNRVDFFDSKMQVVAALQQTSPVKFKGEHRAVIKKYNELLKSFDHQPATAPSVQQSKVQKVESPVKVKAQEVEHAKPVEPVLQPPKRGRGRPPKNKPLADPNSAHPVENSTAPTKSSKRQQLNAAEPAPAPAPAPKLAAPIESTRKTRPTDSGNARQQQLLTDATAQSIQGKTKRSSLQAKLADSPAKPKKPVLPPIIAVVGKERTPAGKTRYQVMREGCTKEEAVWLEPSARISDALISQFEEQQRVESACCCICRDDNSLETNLLLLCDGCDLPVHQLCYGVPEVPDGDWFCRLCAENGNKKPKVSPKCTLCPFGGGALKRTTEGGWAHLQCALWLPETSIEDSKLMEPIVGCAAVDKKRQTKLSCYLCQEESGYCIQCSHPGCYVAYHPFCAAKYVLHLDACEDPGGGVKFVHFCHAHDPERPLDFFKRQLPAFVFEKKPKPMKPPRPKPVVKIPEPENPYQRQAVVSTPSSGRRRHEIQGEEKRTPGSCPEKRAPKASNPLDFAWGELGRPRTLDEIATPATHASAPNCHRCKVSHPERGYASCEHGHHHHLCHRCVTTMVELDWDEVLADPSIYCCPVCNDTCICAACTRRRGGIPERRGTGVRRRRSERDSKGPRAQHSTKGIKGTLGQAELADRWKTFWQDDEVYRQPITRESAAWQLLTPEAMQQAMLKLVSSENPVQPTAAHLDDPSCGMWSFRMVVPGAGTTSRVQNRDVPAAASSSAAVPTQNPDRPTATAVAEPLCPPGLSLNLSAPKGSLGQIVTSPTSAFVAHARSPGPPNPPNDVSKSALGSWVPLKPAAALKSHFQRIPDELKPLCGPVQVKATPTILKPQAQKKMCGVTSIFREYDSTLLPKVIDPEDACQHDISSINVSAPEPRREPIPECTNSFINDQLDHMNRLLQRQVEHNTRLLEQVQRTVSDQLDAEVTKLESQKHNKAIEQEFAARIVKEEKAARAEPADDNNEVCEYCNDGGDLLCCDGCPGCFHLYCISPPLDEPPEGEWFCTACRDKRNRQQRLCSNMDLGGGKASPKPRATSKDAPTSKDAKAKGVRVAELISEADQKILARFAELKGHKGNKRASPARLNPRHTVKGVSQELQLNVNCVYALLRGEWFQSPQTIHPYIDKLRDWVNTHMNAAGTPHRVPEEEEQGILGVSMWSATPQTSACEICGQTGGARIACSHQGCRRHYHPHCACNDKTLYMRVGSFKLWKDSFLYCAEHVPPEISSGLGTHLHDCDKKCDVCFHVGQLRGEVVPATHQCSRCAVQVHSGCYPVEEGDWLCQPCKLEVEPTCCLCNRPGGAMLKTDNDKWAHVSCAVWTPDVSIGTLGVVQEVEQELYCLCRQPDTGRMMIGCDMCGDWFHPECIGVDPQKETYYLCSSCQPDKAVEPAATMDEEQPVADTTEPQQSLHRPVKVETKPLEASKHKRGKRGRPCDSCGKSIGYNTKKCKHCGSVVCRRKKQTQVPSPELTGPDDHRSQEVDEAAEGSPSSRKRKSTTEEYGPEPTRAKTHSDSGATEFVDLTLGDSDESGRTSTEKDEEALLAAAVHVPSLTCSSQPAAVLPPHDDATNPPQCHEASVALSDVVC